MTYKDIYSTCQIELNPQSRPSVANTYSIMVTGWTPADKLSWDLCPNSLVRGQLYSTAGVARLLNNLAHNPQVDRVYLFNLTQYDRNSGSILAAYHELSTIGFPVALIENLQDIPRLPTGSRPEITPLPIKDRPKVDHTYHPSGLTIQGDNVDLVQAQSQSYILKHGTYYPEREFTALPVITHVIFQNSPVPYEPYFDLWLEPSTDLSVDYTYGDYLKPALPKLQRVDNSTQVTVHLELPGSKNPPCLALVQRWQDNLIASFRSHDIGQAFIPNAKALLYVMQFLGLKGKLHIVSNVPHIYDWDRPVKTPLFVPDPLGNITGYKLGDIFYLEKNNIPWIQANSKRGLKRKIAQQYPVLDTTHSFYISELISSL